MNKNKTLLFFLIILGITISMFGFTTVSVFENIPTHKYLAIIIDDFGNNSAGTKEMLALPIKFTGAVMPQMPYSDKDAEALISNGKAVILHQPMEAHTGKISWLGPAPILGSMSAEKAGNIFEQNINSILDLKGFNNHMGSLITEDKEKMDEIMRIAKEKNLYFIDSVTTANSAAKQAAEKYGVPYYKRDVFLDSTQDKAAIKRNLQKAADIASDNCFALAIGHVGAEGGKVTAEAISEMLPVFEQQGIELITIEDLISQSAYNSNNYINLLSAES